MKTKFALSLLSIASAAAISAPAFAADYAANNCEIFVDKLKIASGSHALTNFTFYVKIIADKLDAPVVAVEVFHRRSETTSTQDKTEFDWKFDRVASYFGSSDYFEYSTVTGHDWLRANEEMTFSVVTASGTRYWANAYGQPGANFVASNDSINDISFDPSSGTPPVSGRPLYRQDAASRSVFASVTGGRLENIAKTADFPSDLRAKYNVNSCR